jgi:preprotein translocase subunit SecY
MHLCLWGGVGLALIGIYSYIWNYIPFVQDIIQSIGSLPMVVTWSGIIIIVGVVQEIVNKINTEMLMQRYDKVDLDTMYEEAK